MGNGHLSYYIINEFPSLWKMHLIDIWLRLGEQMGLCILHQVGQMMTGNAQFLAFSISKEQAATLIFLGGQTALRHRSCYGPAWPPGPNCWKPGMICSSGSSASASLAASTLVPPRSVMHSWSYAHSIKPRQTQACTAQLMKPAVCRVQATRGYLVRCYTGPSER